MSDTQAASEPKAIGTVLVVGGCGFLGSHVVDQLLNFPAEDIASNSNATKSQASSRQIPKSFPSLRSRYPSYSSTGTKVHALDLRCEHNRLPNCTYHEADLTSTDSLLEVFQKVKPDVVINTASPKYDSPPHILRKVNLDGTQNLLNVAGGVHGDWGGKCKVFVHTSSASVVHDAESDLRFADERYPYVCPNPREYYSETKVYAEKQVLEANDKPALNNMLTAAVRPAGIVGERDMGGFGYSIVKTASMAPSWQLHMQLGAGDNLFDNTYVGNVAYGLLCAADALLITHSRKLEGKAAILDHERVDGEAFNVTNDEPAYFWDLAHFLYSRYGREVRGDKIWKLPRDFILVIGGLNDLVSRFTGRKGKLTTQNVKYSCLNRYYSCEKLKRRCGYMPKVGVEEGLERTVEWFKGFEQEEREMERQQQNGEKQG